MLQTLERTHTFDARVLTADNAAAAHPDRPGRTAAAALPAPCAGGRADRR